MTSHPRSGSKLKQSDEGLDGALLALLHASSLACITTDKARRITSCNASAESLLGRDNGEIVRQPLSRIIPNGSGTKEIAGDTTSVGHADVSIEKKNGETVKVEIWSSMLPAQAGHLLLLQNTTEKKFLENALLEAADREQRRIGQDLHDHLCQHLLGAAFSAKALAGALDREESRHAPQLHDLARLINDAVAQVRDISRGLHPV
ncbi:MAG TPA: histidine kinase, partial [Chthoniobacteraceae bacterium]|nr:histidine kinase [Chthoniobacteraceae bacterium]